MIARARRVAAARRTADGDGRDDGFTLVEVLVAVMLMGLVFTVILTGIFAAIVTTKRNRQSAEGDRMARGLVEELKESDAGSLFEYKPCAVVSGGPSDPVYPSYTPPAPDDEWRVTVVKIEYPVPGNMSAWGTSCTLDAQNLDLGAQRITVEARPPSTVAETPVQTVVLIKRDTRGDGS